MPTIGRRLRDARIPPIQAAAVLLAGLSLLSPRAALAGEAERAQAEMAFQAAVEKLKAGNAAEACPLLEESDRLDPQPGTEYELAKCYAAIGRHASAWSRFRALAEKLDARGEREKAEKVRQHVASAIEPKLARLAIVVSEAVGQLPGLSVRRDGIPVGRPIWGTAVPVDPGAHRVRVVATGKRAWESSVDVTTPGATLTVTVPDLQDEPAATVVAPPPQMATPPPSSPPQPPPDKGWPGQRKAAVAVGALGVAGLAVGLGLGIAALGKGSAWKEAVARDCNEALDCRSPAAIQSIRDLEGQRSAFATGSTIGFVAGAVAAGGALALWFSAPRDPSPRAGLSITPWAGAGGGLVVRGAY